MSATITSTTIQTHEPSIAIQSEKKDSVIVTESELPLSNGHRIDRGNDHGSRYLVVSPYTEREHLLDLETVDPENQLLAQAMVHLRCVREDYATAPYLDIFNWTQVVDILRSLTNRRGHAWKETSFYIVAFRSQIPPTTVYAELGELDRAAHIEATASGGFLKYWFGDPDADGRNLATCVWRSRDDAKLGNVGPAHRKAAGATRAMYSNWRIDRHRLIIRDGIESWDIIDWVD